MAFACAPWPLPCGRRFRPTWLGSGRAVALTPRGWLGSLPCVRSCPPPLAAAPGGTGRPLPPRPPARPSAPLSSRPPVFPSALPPLRRLPLVRPFALLPARAPVRLPAPRLPVLSRRVAVCVSWSCPVLASGWCCACPPPPLGASPCVPRLCCLSSSGSCSPPLAPASLLPPCRSRFFPLSAWSFVFPLRRSVLFSSCT